MKYRRDDEGTYIDYEVDGYADISTWQILGLLVLIWLAAIGVGCLLGWLLWG